MRNWNKLFKSSMYSGIYGLDGDEDIKVIEELAEENRLGYFYNDLSGVDSKESFLRTSAEALQFPSYFGMNWDAFEECIYDFSWSPAAGYVLVFDKTGIFSSTQPQEWETAMSIFSAAAKFWKKQRKPFFVIIVS